MKIERGIPQLQQIQSSNLREVETKQTIESQLFADERILNEQRTQLLGILDKHRFRPDAEQQKEIRSFLSDGDSKRLETLDIALFKGIEPTQQNLEAVHAGLHEPIEPMEAMIGSELNAHEAPDTAEHVQIPNEIRRVVVERVRSGIPLKQALMEAATELGLTQVPRTLSKLIEAIRAIAAPKGEAFSIAVEDPVEDIPAFVLSRQETTSDLAVPVAAERRALVAPHPENIMDESAEKRGVEPQRASFDESAGEPAKATEVKAPVRQPAVVQTASQVVDTPEIIEETEQAVLAALQQISAQLSRTIESFDYRTFLVQEQTELTQKARVEFDQFVHDFSQQLQRPSAENIQGAIDALSKAINRSNFAMLTDMKTEKTLLVAASDLQNAQEMLKSGAIIEAQRIVKQVRETIEAIDFRPSVRKIQLMTEYRALRVDRMLLGSPHSLRKQFEEGLRLFSVETARDVLERVRMTGTNHEVEVYEQTKPAVDLVNLKEILLRLGDTGESSLLSLTGQQMSNNSDDRRREFYSFDVPLSVDGEIEGMKVYLKGRSEGNQLDWKNTELYFGLSSKRYGTFGIRVAIVGGNAKIDLLSDAPQELMMRLEGIEKPLEEVGFAGIELRAIPYREPKLESPISQDPAASRRAPQYPVADVYGKDRRSGLDYKI